MRNNSWNEIKCANCNKKNIKTDYYEKIYYIYGTGTIIIDFNPDILDVTDVKDGEGSTIVAWNPGNTRGTGEISTSVEVLRNTSGLLDQSPPGIAFRNVNIWVGTSGFASPQNIKSATINFKIDKEWLENANIDAGSIKLMRYTNMWNDLPTRQIESTEKEIHYQADTQGFTFFAIIANRKIYIT